VLERAGKLRWGGLKSAWRCRCDCGRVEIYPQDRLPHRDSIPASHRVEACSVCRRPSCEVCGTPVPADRPRSNTCSEVCRQAQQRANQRAYWHRQMTRDPDHAMRQYRRKRERMAEDPEYAARLREQWREQHRRHRAKKSPDELERDREWQRQWYEENRGLILEQRRKRLYAMSPEERAEYDEHRRRLGREWRRRWRAWLDRNPEEKARYRQRYREWVRERELRELMAAFGALEESNNE